MGVVDRDPKAPGMRLGDDAFVVSTNDSEAVGELALRYRPVGVLTVGTDRPMRSVARATALLGLPGPGEHSVIRSTDKWEMSRAFHAASVPAPRSVVVGSSGEVTSGPALRGRLIVKPVDSSGSRGVRLVDSWGRVGFAVDEALVHSPSGRVIVQEYVVGREVSVEGLCVDGRVHIFAATDKLTTGTPHFVELGHSQPAGVSSTELRDLQQLTVRAVAALGLNSCGIHAEMMITSNGPVMIELGPRLGGDFITSHLVPLSTGVDPVDAVVRLATGQDIELAPKWSRGSAVRFLDGPVASEQRAHLLARAREVPGVIEAMVDRTESGTIRSSGDRFGYVISAGATAADAVASAEHAVSILLDR